MIFGNSEAALNATKAIAAPSIAIFSPSITTFAASPSIPILESASSTAVSKTLTAPSMNAFPILLTLPKNTSAVSVRFLKALSASPPVVITPRRFFAAAFMLANEPEKVELASLAVVPVTPRLSCITWIASYTSFRLLISYLTPLNFSASARSLSISDFVPP